MFSLIKVCKMPSTPNRNRNARSRLGKFAVDQKLEKAGRRKLINGKVSTEPSDLEEVRMHELLTSMKTMHATQINTLQEIKEDLHPLKNDVQEMRAQVTNIDSRLSEVEHLRAEVDRLKLAKVHEDDYSKSMIEALRWETNQLYEDNLSLHCELLRKDLLLINVYEEANEDTLIVVKRFLREHMDISSRIEIMDAYRIGSRSSGRRSSRPIVINFGRRVARDHVLKMHTDCLVRTL